MIHGPTTSVIDQSWSVAQTVHRLFQHIDDARIQEAAALFAPEGYWVRMGERLTGPQAVLQALMSRPASLRTRHLATNMVVDLAPGASNARYYLTVFDHQGPADQPSPMQLPQFMFVCEDELVHTEGGWRFLRREPRMLAKR